MPASCEKGFSITIGPVWEFAGTYIHLDETGPPFLPMFDLVVRANFGPNEWGVSDFLFDANAAPLNPVLTAGVTDFRLDYQLPLTSHGAFAVCNGFANQAWGAWWDFFFWLPATYDFTKKWRITFNLEADFGPFDAVHQTSTALRGWFFTDPQGAFSPPEYDNLVASQGLPLFELLATGFVGQGIRTYAFDHTIDSGGVPKGLHLQVFNSYCPNSGGPATPGPAVYVKYDSLAIVEVP